MLVARTGNTKMHNRSDGVDTHFRRVADLGQDVLANNEGGGIINVADLTFTLNEPASTIIHELGHNWDTDGENPTAHTFFDLSHWRVRFHMWTYDPNAVFAN